MKIARILFLLFCLLLLLYGLFAERHVVADLVSGKGRELNGLDLIGTATYDGLMREGDRLYDTHSYVLNLDDYKACAT